MSVILLRWMAVLRLLLSELALAGDRKIIFFVNELKYLR